MSDSIGHGRDRGQSAIDRNLVGREPHATALGEVLKLGHDRRAIRSVDALLPFIKPIGEREMDAALAAIDGTASPDLDRRDIVGADMTIRVDPYGGDAGRAQRP